MVIDASEVLSVIKKSRQQNSEADNFEDGVSSDSSSRKSSPSAGDTVAESKGGLGLSGAVKKKRGNPAGRKQNRNKSGAESDRKRPPRGSRPPSDVSTKESGFSEVAQSKKSEVSNSEKSKRSRKRRRSRRRPKDK
jgi:hypothetical protein